MSKDLYHNHFAVLGSDYLSIDYSQHNQVDSAIQFLTWNIHYQDSLFPPCYKQKIRSQIRLSRRLQDRGLRTEALQQLVQVRKNLSSFYGEEDSKYIEAGLLAARLYTDLSKHDTAIQVLEHIESICLRDSSKIQSLVDLYNIWGRVYSNQMQFDQAIFYSKKQIHFLEQLYPEGSVPMFAGYHNLGARFMDYGEHVTAGIYLRNAEAMALSLLDSMHPYYAIASMTLGTYYERIKDFELAQKYTETSLNIRRRIYHPEHRNIISALINLAVLYRNSGNYSRAHKVIDEALDKVISSDDDHQKAHCRLIKGQIFQYQGAYAQAADWVNHAWESFSAAKTLEQLNNPVLYLNLFENELINHYGLCRETMDLDILDDALYRSSEGIELFLWRFNNTLQIPDQRKLLTEYRSLFDYSSALFLSRYLLESDEQDLYQAYRHAYTVKSFQSNQVLLRGNPKVTDTEWSAVEKLQTEIAELKVAYLREASSSPSTEINSLLIKKQELLDTLFQKFNMERNISEVISTPDLQRLIQDSDPDRILLDFILMEDRLLAYRIQDNKLEGRNFDFDQQIYRLIQDWPGLTWSPLTDLVPFDPLFEFLQEILHWANPSGKPLTIIPDKQLISFPFDILQWENQYAAFSFPIHYEHYLRTYENSSISEHEVISFAPTYSMSNEGDLEEIQIAALVRSGEWTLPFAQEEVRSIHKHFRGQSYRGLEATVDQFLDVIQDNQIVHLSMHAVVNPDQPWDSKLLFNHKDLSIEPFYLHQLTQRKLRSPLMVLSACDTGIGLKHDSEGIQNFSTALQQSGVPAIIHSLWKISDHSTAIIMTRFYQHLANGKPKDEALQMAKRDYLNQVSSEKELHPYYWAGLVHSGNPQSLILKNKPSYYLWLLGTGVFFLIVLGIAYIRDRIQLNSVSKV